MSNPESTFQRLRPLFLPVYLPTLVYAAGGSLLVAVQVLLALQLGLSASGVAAVTTALGAFAILSSLFAGAAVQKLGERAAVTGFSVFGAAVLTIAWALILFHSVFALAFFLIALVLFDLVDAVWAIARQGMVSDLAPPDLRGRATNLYGACQRIGRVFGPLLAAPALLVVSGEWLLPVAGAIVVAASVILVRFSPLSDATHGSGAMPDSGSVHSAEQAVTAEPEQKTKDRSAPSLWKPLLLLGFGIMVLATLRTAQSTLIPLWGKSGIALHDSTVALVVGSAAAMELVLFWPAGLALDKWGRMPVVVTALVSMGLGMFVLPAHVTLFWYAGFAMMIGLGNGVGSGIIKTMGMDVAPTDARATFFGRWQAVASVGALVSPAVAWLVMEYGSLALALQVLGGLGIVGALWMAWWTPRFIPRVRH